MSAPGSRRVLRGFLWGLLAVVLMVLAVLTFQRVGRRAEPPPVLGELPAFSLSNRDGRTVSLGDLQGAPWVADFIFTRCQGPCPLMTRRMAELGGVLPEGVGRVSFTVDPEYDTPEVLAAYAAGYGAAADWLFLTGPRPELWDLSVKGFKLGVGFSGGEPDDHGLITHSTRFVLVDGAGRIRGYYDGFEKQDRQRLVAEARALLAEGG